MKSTSFFILSLLFGATILFAQAPQAFKYQTVIRNAAGEPLENQSVGIRLSILAGSPSGDIIYSESHTLSTNQFGLVTLQVGNGTVITGTFPSINWGNNEHFLKVEADISGGNSYLHMGTAQLLSVPYALYSENSGNAASGSGSPTRLAFWDGSTSLSSDSNLFWDNTLDRMGIGTGTPAARFHVSDSAVVFTGPLNLPANPSEPPISGPGIRMMWYPDQAAFRTGRVNGAQWDKDSVGRYSFACGYSTKASGIGTSAFGLLNEVTGNYSHASGFENKVSGRYSSCFGSYNIVSGDHAFAFGDQNIASGDMSTALGFNSTATGSISVACGVGVTAQSYMSDVFGLYNVIGGSSTLFIDSDPLFVIGNGKAPSNRKNAFTLLKNGRLGIGTTTPYARFHVSDSAVVFTGAASLPANPSETPLSGAGIRMMWYPDKAAFRAGYVNSTQWDKNSIGTYSFASGYGVVASGSRATAFGDNNNATGDFSFTMGAGNTASGSHALAAGNTNVASGETSVAMGKFNTASGKYTAAFGLSTTAQSFLSTVFGRFNKISGNSDSWVDTDPLFIVGNGTNSSSPENALTVLKNGNVGIQESSPDCRLVVKSGTLGDIAEDWLNWIVLNGSTTAGNTENLKLIHRRHAAGTDWHTSEIRLQRVVDQTFMNYIAFKGSNSGSVIEFGSGPYNDPRMTFNDAGTLLINATGSSAHKLYVNGSAYSTVSWQSSDEKFKKNIHAIENPLGTLFEINGKTYHWKTDEYPQFGKDSQKQYGFIAQEIEEILPELVNTDLNGEKALCYDQLIPILVEAVKELKKQNEAALNELKKQNDALQHRIDVLERIFNK